MRSALIVAAVLVACGTPSPKATIPAPPPKVDPTVATKVPTAPVVRAKATKVRSVEGITEYKLDNGLQVLLFPDPTQSNVTINVTYLVGSRSEGYGETGMAHLLEHMLFKGTKRHRDISKLLEERGGQNNGSTWMDRTNYYETLPATPENLEFAIDLEADRMINSTILAEDLSTEFSVVRNEFEMGENEPLAVLQQRISATAYLWHNYGKDTIGSRSDIERVPVPALRAFYERYYQPDNAVLVVSGKFDNATALAHIEKYFGAIPKPARELPTSYTVEPQQDGERDVTLRRNGDIFAVGVAYHTVGAASPDFPAVQAAFDILDREPSGRLYKKLVATKLASSVGGGPDMFRDPNLAMMIAEVRDQKTLDKVQQIMIDEIEKLGASKIDEKAVERWRVATLKRLELSFANSEEIAVELSEFAALGDWRSIFAYRDRVEKITVADVTRVAKMYFKASNRTSGRFIPTKDADRAPLTESPDIAAVVKGIEDRPVKDPGEAFAATLENIESRTVRSVLPSGIKSAVLAKKTRGAKVELRFNMHWGDEKSLQGKAVIGELCASLMQRGTKKRSYQDLQDEENLFKSRIYLGGGADSFALRIETLRDKLPSALDLAAEILRSPSFPASELELIKEEEIAALEQQLQDPSSIAWTVLAQLTTQWPKSDPRYPMSAKEKIDAIKRVTVADIQRFYKDFVGATHAELAIVGDTDAAAITTHVDKLFGNWGSKKPFARLAQKVWNVPAMQKTIDIKDKEMSQLALSHDVSMKDVDPDYPAWVLVGQALGGDSGSRIWQRLREKEGLSYGSGAWTYAGVLDDTGGFGGHAIVAPQNVAKAKASMLDEIQKMATGTISPEELARAKAAWLKGQDTELSSDTYVASMLANQTYYGRTTEITRSLRAKISAVTVEDFARVAKKYLHPDKLVIVDAGSTPSTPRAPAP
jgi:zinc protease